MSNFESIRELLRKWDPIGINDEHTAQDEYDQYVNELIFSAEKFKDSLDIIRYLQNLEVHMGVPATEPRKPREIAEQIYEALIDLKAKPEGGLSETLIEGK